MTTARLLDLWAPPEGYRLANLLATTYQLHADFIEEDLLPVALGLRRNAAHGRDFRIELESALQDVEVTILLHPDGYQPGMRRSPRIDLVPVPESRIRKLHAKVALLVFVPEQDDAPDRHIVRLVTGSANLTSNGYRQNIEMAVVMDDAPGALPAVSAVVRQAQGWLQDLLPDITAQVQSQHRAMLAVFASRPVRSDQRELQFVGLPREGGLLTMLNKAALGKVTRLTIVSPFWPTGEEAGDMAIALKGLCKGATPCIGLIGPCHVVAGDQAYPEMPPALLKAFIENGLTDLEVAYARPDLDAPSSSSTAVGAADEEGEFDQIDAGAGAGGNSSPSWRPLHAKAILIEGDKACLLAMGSFNFTRRGLGLYDAVANTEAGIVWTLPLHEADTLLQALQIGAGWTRVEGEAGTFVRPPMPMDGSGGQVWPGFIHAIKADRQGVHIDGDGERWPSELRLRMRDIRSRQTGAECDFDPWIIARPEEAAPFSRSLPLTASWLDPQIRPALAQLPALPDLEVTLEWEGQHTILPVVFIDKHEFPVIERSVREDERLLLDWFLGLRPINESGADGFGHGFDPLPTTEPASAGETNGILSYLVRDFVHALPGIRAQLLQGAATETGLRTVLLGPRSPASLAREIRFAWEKPSLGKPVKTEVATLFQLVELHALVAAVQLPALPDGQTEVLRQRCLAIIQDHFSAVIDSVAKPLDPVLARYLAQMDEVAHEA